MDCQIIILAAGNGSRMSSELPKVMHKVAGKPMIERVLLNAKQVTNDIILVYSSQLKSYLAPYDGMCQFALQSQPLGTAHAVYSALDLIDDNKVVGVLYGDNPLISAEIIEELLEKHHLTNSAITTLSFKRDNPGQYGRIVTDEFGNFLKIVEFKEATEKEKEITICNSGIMAFSSGILKKYLPQLVTENSYNEKKELYLTEMVKICKNNAEKVSYILSPNQNAVIGVNTQEELEEANKIID